MSDERDAERGAQAKAVLENPIYLDAYAQIEAEFTRKWRESRDPAEREDIHRALLMLTKARAVLEATMASGKVAAANLTRQQGVFERVAERSIRAVRSFT